jgi:hypothetical protein
MFRIYAIGKVQMASWCRAIVARQLARWMGTDFSLFAVYYTCKPLSKGGNMDALRIFTIIEQDGELRVSNLPLKKGQRIELLVLPEPPKTTRPMMTADDIRTSPIVGLWADRTDIGDSTEFARQLRERAQRRM